MFALPGVFTLNTYATERPMILPMRVYTNETSTAQSVPLADRVDYNRVGVGTKATIETGIKPNISPQNPASPQPKTTQQDSNSKAFKNPVLWIGVAAGVFALFWVVRRA